MGTRLKRKTHDPKLNTTRLQIAWLISFVLLAIAVFAPTFQDTTQGNFDGGTYNKTVYNTSSTAVELGNHTAQELPANGSTRNTTDGVVNMTGNVLLLHFNNDSTLGENNTTFFDSSGMGNNGTCVPANCSTVNITQGKLNGSMSFSGSNQYINLSNSSSLHPSSAITVMAWIRRSGSSADAVISASTNAGNDWGLDISNVAIRFFVMVGGSFRAAEGTTTVSAGEWHHVAGTYDGETVYSYLNGIQEGTNTVPSGDMTTTTQSVIVGELTTPQASGEDFGGNIDEVAVWNRSLSAAEIRDIYTRQKGAYIDRGNFTSRVFFNSGSLQWDNISWIEGAPYGEELPDLARNENLSGIPGGINMTGNVLLLHFNETANATAGAQTCTSGGFSVGDSSGNKNCGNESGGVTFNGAGKFGSAISLDGTNDRVRIPDNAQHTPTINGFTVSAWAKLNNIQTTSGESRAPIVSKFGTTEQGNWEWTLLAKNDSSGATNWTMWTTTSAGATISMANSTTKVVFDQWYHIVSTVNGDTGVAEIYVNGVLEGSGASGALPSNTATDVKIGMDRGNSINWFTNGIIDEVAIFNRSLSAAEIRNMHLRGAMHLNLTVRTSADNITYTDWVGIGNSTTAKFNNSTYGNLSGLNNVSYFQYRIEFDNFAVNDTPQLFNVTVNYTVLNVLPAITINSPANNTFSSSPRPGIRVTVTDPDASSSYVEIFRNGTNISYGLVQNNTITNLTWTNATTEDGIWTYYVRAYDNISNNVSEGNMTITLVARPAVNISAPGNNTSVTNNTPTVYVTVTDFEELSTYVEIIRNGTNVSYGMQQNNSNTSRFWNNITIADGIYNYYARAYDNNSNNVSSGNLTLVVDANSPNISQNPGSDNNTTVNRTWAFFNFSIVDGTYMENRSIQLNNTVNGTAVNYSFTLEANASNAVINFSNLASRNYSIIVYANDSTSHEATLINTWFKIDWQRPNVTNILNAPNDTNDLDPNDTVVNVTATVVDDFLNITGQGLTNVNLEYSYNGSNGHNTSMSNTSSDVWWGTFTANSTANWTYRIYANDSDGKTNTSNNTTISVAYDYTWTVNPSNLSTTSAAIGNNITIANITVNNTGDYAQVIVIKKDTGVVPAVNLNASFFNLSQGEYDVVTVNVTPPTEAGTYVMSIKFTANNSTQSTATPQVNYSNGTFIARGDGPFLFLSIDYSNATVAQGNDYFINVKVTNYGNESAASAWVAYSVPTGWTGTNDSLGTVGPNETISWSNVSFSVPSSATTGTQSILAYVGFQNYRHNQTSNASTSTVVTAAPSGGTTTTTTGGGGGAGGGGGGGGGGLSEAQKATLFGTAKTYDLVVGKDNAFPFVVGNPYVNGEMHNTTIQVEGLLSQYLRVQPNFVSKIQKDGNFPVRVLITAPAYFTEGKHELTFTISTTVVKGVVRTKAVETTKVVLRVHEISTEQAEGLLDDNSKSVADIGKAGFNTGVLEELRQQAAAAFADGDYKKVSELSKLINELTKKAYDSDKIIKELGGQIEIADRQGAKIPQSIRLLELAKAAFSRGDFETASERIKEAELTFLVETKGFFNLVYAIRSNLNQIIMATIAAVVLSIVLFLYGEYALLNYELGKMRREEQILLGLMKAVQRACFEEKKMSMKEYSEAMYQYENKLNGVVQKLVELESKKSNLFKVGREEQRLRHEAQRMMEMIRDTQKKYIEKGTLETRIYQDKMQSFTGRLGEVDEKLAVIEAQKELEKKTSAKWKIFAKLFRKKI